MNKLVVYWILTGSLGFTILPWYLVDDGFFSFYWLLEYDIDYYGSGFLKGLFYNNWLLPIVIPLFLPLILFSSKLKLNPKIYSNIFLFSGLIGFTYFFIHKEKSLATFFKREC